LRGNLQTLVNARDSMSQYDGDFDNVLRGEEDARHKREMSLKEAKRLSDIQRLCVRHPAHMPALIYELEEKIAQDAYLLGT
jgi:hypothetical protein